MKFFQKMILFVGWFTAARVQAHSGANGAEYYLTEPHHLIAIGAVVLGISGIIFFLQRLRRQYR